jgi:hypothetical protein
MKTLKAFTISELKEKVIKTDWYKMIQKRLYSIESLIEISKQTGYISRDLTEERSMLKSCLNITMYGANIKKGYNNNRPIIYCQGGHSLITWINGTWKGNYFGFFTFTIPKNK